MPSASAKVEKIASLEAADPVKQIVNMVEKRMRNLEKRKIKLDNYKLDVKNGKELNEDQKIAVSKYDQVESILEFSRDICKSMHAIVLDSAKQQKKLAKKEQLERQQHEIQRLQEAFIYCHILSCFQNADVRSDFLNGENGAVQLTSEQLSQLDQLHKLIGPGLPTEQADITNHFHALAENYIFLVEGKNKEIIGTTYKILKDLLQSIKESGYFSRPSETLEEDGTSSDDLPEEESAEKITENNEATNTDICNAQPEEVETDKNDNAAAPSLLQEITPSDTACLQNGSLQEVLSTQGAFNFLQESQIDLDAPHMDPAVVAVHQMAPPPAVNFAGNTYCASPPNEEKPITNHSDTPEADQTLSVNEVPVVSTTLPRNIAPVISPIQINSQQEFDPSHPIPTQTFTNQSFAVMQNMIMPQGYVPVTMHHAPIPPHITPIAVVPGLSPPVTSGASVVPLHVPVAPIPVATTDNTQYDSEPKNDDVAQISEDIPAAEVEASNNTNDKNGENGFTSSYNRNGGFRRGRGRGNNFYRGRGNYSGRGGGYQNHYYQDRNNYNGNYRRNNNRGPRENGSRGRGSYRTQQGTSNQQQQQQTHE